MYSTMMIPVGLLPYLYQHERNCKYVDCAGL